MVLVEGNALENAGRPRAIPDDRRIVAERPDDDLGARAPIQLIARRTDDAQDCRAVEHRAVGSSLVRGRETRAQLGVAIKRSTVAASFSSQALVQVSFKRCNSASIG